MLSGSMVLYAALAIGLTWWGLREFRTRSGFAALTPVATLSAVLIAAAAMLTLGVFPAWLRQTWAWTPIWILAAMEAGFLLSLGVLALMRARVRRRLAASGSRPPRVSALAAGVAGAVTAVLAVQAVACLALIAAMVLAPDWASTMTIPDPAPGPVALVLVVLLAVGITAGTWQARRIDCDKQLVWA